MSAWGFAFASAAALFFVSSPPLRAQQQTLWTRDGFTRPSVAIDLAGNILVADAGGNRVIVFSSAGDSIAGTGGSGWGNDQFDNPVAVASSGLFVFVADRDNHRIQRFARDLTFVATLSTRETGGPSAFGYPSGIAVAAEGDMYITDGENKRVVKFNAFGQFVRAFGGVEGGSRFMLQEPTQVATTTDGSVFVLDRGRVAAFDGFGTPRGWISLPDGARGIAADGQRLFALLDGRLLVVHPGTDQATITLPPGAWRTVAVRGTTVVLGDDSRVRVLRTE